MSEDPKSLASSATKYTDEFDNGKNRVSFPGVKDWSNDSITSIALKFVGAGSESSLPTTLTDPTMSIHPDSVYADW